MATNRIESSPQAVDCMQRNVTSSASRRDAGTGNIDFTHDPVCFLAEIVHLRAVMNLGECRSESLERIICGARLTLLRSSESHDKNKLKSPANEGE